MCVFSVFQEHINVCVFSVDIFFLSSSSLQIKRIYTGFRLIACINDDTELDTEWKQRLIWEWGVT